MPHRRPSRRTPVPRGLEAASARAGQPVKQRSLTQRIADRGQCHVGGSDGHNCRKARGMGVRTQAAFFLAGQFPRDRDSPRFRERELRASPARTAEAASTWTARVVLPVPPFWATSAIVCTASETESLSGNKALGNTRRHFQLPTDSEPLQPPRGGSSTGGGSSGTARAPPG